MYFPGESPTHRLHAGAYPYYNRYALIHLVGITIDIMGCNSQTQGQKLEVACAILSLGTGGVINQRNVPWVPMPHL